MTSAPLPPDEEARLACLHSYPILDTPSEGVLEAITALAAEICGTRYALISLVDRDRQWFKSAKGMEQGGSTARRIAFAAHAILEPDRLMEVPDATLDPRFVDNPLVTRGHRARFYAGVPLKSPGGHALGALCVVDPTPRQLDDAQRNALQVLAGAVTTVFEARKLQALSERRLETLYANTPAMLYSLDARGGIFSASQQWLEAFGYTFEQVRGRDPHDLMTPESRAQWLALRAQFEREGGCHNFPCRFVRASGELMDALLSAHRETDPATHEPRTLCVLMDVTEQLRLQRELERMTRIDAMTGALSRSWSTERLRVELKRAQRHRRPLSVVLFDVDFFKMINDTYGHAAGDAALTHLVSIAQSQLRDSDEIGRLGGEEFVLILPETPRAGAETVAERLRRTVGASELAFNGHALRFTISLGVAEAEGRATPDSLLSCADEAMYEAKRSGRNRTIAWQPSAPVHEPAEVVDRLRETGVDVH
jgi:diguanylate cyclase (GGDEF)-like protein/PAS domain S-box-containing protein